MTLDFIDVSSYNALANLGQLDGQIARASSGTLPDWRYPAHTVHARNSGVHTGAYHFGTNESVPSQVATFVASIARSGPVNLYALDREFNGPHTMTLAQADEFMKRFHSETGRTIGLYHSLSGYPHLSQAWDWKAAWDATTFPPGAEMWQWQGNPIDRDRWHTDEAGFLAFIGFHAVRYRVLITGPTRLYSRVGGDVIGAVTKATYTAVRLKVSGLWWYRIDSGHRKGEAFKPNRYTKASVIS